jgi:hypothetical protein
LKRLAIKKELKDILKHDNRWINIVMGRILKGLEPQAWTQVIKRFVPPFCSFQKVNVQSHTTLLNLKLEVSFSIWIRLEEKRGDQEKSSRHE